jgi:stage IV sporulation protein FB
LVNFGRMEHIPASSYEPGPAVQSDIVYPPKYEKQEQPGNIWMKSIMSLALYLLLGYYIFHSFDMLLVITGIVVLHEMGHFLAMKFFRYKELGIFFIPLLGAYVSGTKREVSEKQSAIILLAGPLPGIIIGIALYLFNESSPGHSFLDISLSSIGRLFVVLNLINLIPIYPLDGGQLLNRVFLDEEGWMGKIFVFLSALFMCWLAWQSKVWVLLIIPAMMLLRLRTDKKFDQVEKSIEAEGINLDTSYEQLTDEDYWKTRNILIREHPSFRDMNPTPPFAYHPKEDKVMTTIQSLLHRHLIQDLSLIGKLFILLIWIAAFAAPWLTDMDLLPYLSRFGF